MPTSTPTTVCPYEAVFEEEQSNYQSEPLVDPIDIISFDNTSVTFAVSQPWTNETLCVISTYYHSGNDIYECPSETNVGFGPIGEYTAECIDGEAVVVLYVHDESFPVLSDTVIDVPEKCPVFNDGSQTEMRTYTLSCAREETDLCPYPVKEICSDLETNTIAYDGFDTAESVNSFVDGHQGSFGDQFYLKLDARHREVYKSYMIPALSESADINFAVVYSLENAPDFIYARVGDFDIPIVEGYSGFARNAAGDVAIYVSVGFPMELNDFGVLNVTLAIPSNVFTENTLAFGLRIDGIGSSESVAGLEDVSVSMVCASPSSTPSSTPSASPSTIPSLRPSLHPSSSPSGTPTTVCPYEAVFEGEQSNYQSEPLVDPIDIISFDNASVTFAVSQPWTNETLCVISTYYHSGNDIYECPSETNVGFGPIGEYTAECIDGEAVVVLYVHDESFPVLSDTVIDVPEKCPVFNDGSQTEMRTYTLSCAREETDLCPYPVKEICSDLETNTIAYDGFDTAESVNSFVDGHQGSFGDQFYLKLDARHREVYKSYMIPALSESADINFAVVYSLENAPDFIYARVGDFDIPIVEGYSGFARNAAGDVAIYVSVGFPMELNDFGVLNVTLAVPSNVFTENTLAFGLRIDGIGSSEGSSESVAGLEDVSVSMVCASPSSTPSSTPSAYPSSSPQPAKSSASSSSCPVSAIVSNASENIITVLEVMAENVTVSVNQLWNNYVPQLLVSYDSLCASFENVSPGDVQQEFTIGCDVDGYAHGTVYVFGDFSTETVSGELPAACPSRLVGNSGTKVLFMVPCNTDCAEPDGVDWGTLSVDTLLFAEPDSLPNGKNILKIASGIETAATVELPPDALNLKLTLDLDELSPAPASGEVMLRLGNSSFVLGQFNSMLDVDSTSSENVKIEISSSSATENQITIDIPVHEYALKDRLTFGFLTTDIDIGVSKIVLRVYADCHDGPSEANTFDEADSFHSWNGTSLTTFPIYWNMAGYNYSHSLGRFGMDSGSVEKTLSVRNVADIAVFETVFAVYGNVSLDMEVSTMPSRTGDASRSMFGWEIYVWMGEWI